jgi:phage terminase small subunit
MSDLPTEQQIARLNRFYTIGTEEIKPTSKQLAFVRFYVLNGRNATQAAISAGYSKKSACAIGLENLGKPLIIMMLEELELIMIQRYIMSFDKKRGLLGKIADTTSQIIEIEIEELGADGKKTKMKTVQDPKAAIMAIGEDNKMAGHHKDKETVQPVINITFSKLDMAL